MGPALAALGRDDRDSSAALVEFLIRDGIAVAAAVRASDPIAAGRIDQYRGRAAVDAERPDLLRIVAARGQLGDDGVVDQSFEVEIVEAGAVRPERAVKVQGLHPRPLERLVQVRIPGRPEFYDVEERLNDGLVLVVAAGR